MSNKLEGRKIIGKHQEKFVKAALLLATFALLNICVNAQEQDYVVIERSTLKVIPMSVNGTSKLFVLTKEVTEPKKKVGNYYDRLVFFRLKRYDVKNDRPENKPNETIWQRFSYFPVGGGTHPWFMAELKANPIGDRIYLVFAVSNQYKVSLEIHEINPLRAKQIEKIAKFTALQGISALSFEDQEKPMSEFKKEFPPEECGINRIDTIMERDHLLVYADRQDRNCSPVYFRYDLKTKQWAEVTLQEKKIN